MKKILICSVLILVAFGSMLSFADMSYWQVRWHGVYSILVAVGYGLALYGLSMILMRFTRNCVDSRVWVIVACSLLLNVVVAWIVGHYCGQHMVSDFKASLDCLLAGKICVGHPTKYEYWCNYELLISTLGALFSPVLFTGQVLNSICMALVVYPVYKMTERLTSAFAATFVSLLMITSPTLLLYGTFITGEFVAVVALMYGFYWSWQWLQGRPSVFMLLAGGGLLGFSQVFKPIVSIVLVAVFLVCAVQYFESRDGCVGWKILRRFLLVLLVYMGSQNLFSYTANRVMQGLSGKTMAEITEGRGLSWRNFVLGLNLETKGAWHPKLSDLEGEEAKNYLIARMKVDYPHYPKLMLVKLIRLYQGDNWARFWLSKSTHISDSGRCAFAIDVAYVLAQTLFTISIGAFIISYWKRQENLLEYMPMLLTIVGFSLLLMIIEFQGRYRTSIYPFYYIVIAYGVNWLRAQKWERKFQ